MKNDKPPKFSPLKISSICPFLFFQNSLISSPPKEDFERKKKEGASKKKEGASEKNRRHWEERASRV